MLCKVMLASHGLEEAIQTTSVSLLRQGQAVLGSRKLLGIIKPLAEGAYPAAVGPSSWPVLMGCHKYPMAMAMEVPDFIGYCL